MLQYRNVRGGGHGPMPSIRNDYEYANCRAVRVNGAPNIFWQIRGFTHSYIHTHTHTHTHTHAFMLKHESSCSDSSYRASLCPVSQQQGKDISFRHTATHIGRSLRALQHLRLQILPLPMGRSLFHGKRDYQRSLAVFDPRARLWMSKTT